MKYLMTFIRYFDTLRDSARPFSNGWKPASLPSIKGGGGQTAQKDAGPPLLSLVKGKTWLSLSNCRL